MRSSLPVLRLVPVSSLIVHETVDPDRVQRLTRQFASSVIFTNPPLVAPLGAGKYVVLDGANRTTVCTQLGIKIVPAQVVRYADPEIHLRTWNHVLEKTPAAWWESVQAMLKDRLVPTARGKQTNFRGHCTMIVLGNGKTFRVRDSVTTTEGVAMLNALVDSYRGKYIMHRTVDTDIRLVKAQYPHASALIIFPPLRKTTILDYARKGLRIPSGITRHVIPGRVLRLDIPFTLLKSSTPIAEQNRWLNAVITKRKEQNRIRLYNEPVYLYNE